MILPPKAVVAPIARGSKKLAVIVPDEAPPESKAIEVNTFGIKNDKIIEMK